MYKKKTYYTILHQNKKHDTIYVNSFTDKKEAYKFVDLIKGQAIWLVVEYVKGYDSIV